MTSVSGTELVPLQLRSRIGDIGGIQKPAVSSDRPLPITLVLHSAGGGAQSLAAMVKMLNTQGRVVVPDLGGYGQTVVKKDNALHETALEIHRQVIDAVLHEVLQPQQSLVVVGHSMGGFLGLLTALSNRWPVAAVVAIEPVAFSVLDPVEDAAARAEDLDKVLALDAALKAGSPESALGDFIGYWGNTDWAQLSESMRKALLQLAPQIGFETLAVARDDTPPDSYKKLQMPVLLLQGAETVSPAVAVINRLQVLLQSVEVKRIAETAHMGPVRQPDVFASAINDFLFRHCDPTLKLASKA